MRWITLMMMLATTACLGEVAAPEDKALAVKPPAEPRTFTCPMHPNETANSPGKCARCGMDLVEAEAHDHASHDH